MSSQYIRSPAMGGDVIQVANFAALPVAAANGQLFETLDTNNIYAYNANSMTYVAIGGGGVPLSVGTLDSQPATANGATIAANQLVLQSADATHPGLVNNTTQTLSGNKTFTGSISASNLSGTNTGNVTLTAVGAVPNANGASLSGQALTLQPSDTSNPGVLTAADWNTFNNKQNALTLGNLTDAGTDGIVVTGGTGAVVGTGTSIAQHVADATHNGYLSSTDWVAFDAKQPAGNFITDLTGDITATGPGSAATTLATVNSNVGSFGSSTAIPNFTVNAKGLVTAAGSNAVIAPAGTLTGTTLAANVVSSSLTSVGTIASGTWNATTIDVAHGGTSSTTLAANNVLLGNGTSALQVVAPSTSGNVLTSNGTTWVSSPASSGGATPSVILNWAGSQAITLGTYQKLTIATPSFTLLNDFTETGGTLTCTTSATYGIEFGWGLQNPADAVVGRHVRIAIYLNGVLYWENGWVVGLMPNAIEALDFMGEVSTLLPLVSTDTLEAYAYYSNTTNTGTVNATRVQMNIIRY